MTTRRRMLVAGPAVCMRPPAPPAADESGAPWDVVHAANSAEAASALGRGGFDLVLADFRTPRFDGGAILKRARTVLPRSVRVLCCDPSHLDEARRTVSEAQRYLTHDAEPAEWENAVERAWRLQCLLEDAAIARVLGRMRSLPTVPSVYLDLTRALSSEHAGAAEIAGVLERDTSLSARVLQLVNSSFIGVRRRVTSIEQAVLYLGVHVIKNLALSVEVFACDSGCEDVNFSIERLQSHSLLASAIGAKMVGDDRRLAEAAFMTGMLHDIGKLVLMVGAREEQQRALALHAQSGRPLHEVEREIHGASHAEVGAALLARWGLPFDIIEAVAHHHEPRRVTQLGVDSLTVIHVADPLARFVEARVEAAHNATAEEVAEMVGPESQSPAEGGARAELPPGIDTAYLHALGLSARIPAWMDIAEAQARRVIWSDLQTRAGGAGDSPDEETARAA